MNPSDTVACPGCGAFVPPTGVCRFCGSTAFVDGIPGKLLPSDLKCPRCADHPPLRGLEHGGARADLCLACRGVWFGLGVLEEVLRTAAARPATAGEATEGPLQGGIEPVRYARCPRCDGGMAREAVSRRPLVIIDRCPSHGDWCDGGELAQLKSVARARGVEEVLGHGREAGGGRGTGTKDDRDSPLRGARYPGQGPFPPGMEGGGLLGDGGYRSRHRRNLMDVLWDLLDLP